MDHEVATEHLTVSEVLALWGLLFAGNAFISASEHNMALSLCARGYAEARTVQWGMHAWRITDKGRVAVKDNMP